MGNNKLKSKKMKQSIQVFILLVCLGSIFSFSDITSFGRRASRNYRSLRRMLEGDINEMTPEQLQNEKESLLINLEKLQDKEDYYVNKFDKQREELNKKLD